MSNREEASQSQDRCQSCGADEQTGRAVSSGKTDWIGVLRGRLEWFKKLPIGSKVLTAGLALLLALPLLIILSPLAAIACVVLFGISLIGLLVRVGQRRSVKGWGVLVVTSLVLVVAFAGMSEILYGGGLGSTNSGTSSTTTTGYVKNKSSSKTTNTTPSYKIIDSWRMPLQGGYSHIILYVFSDSVSEKDLEWIAKDIRPKLQRNDSAIVMVWDKDQVSYNPTAPFVSRVSTKEGGYVSPAADIVFALTPRGASNQGIATGIPVGQYEIRHE